MRILCEEEHCVVLHYEDVRVCVCVYDIPRVPVVLQQVDQSSSLLQLDIMAKLICRYE